MTPIISRLTRLVSKRASPRPWDLPGSIALEELLQVRSDLQFQLGPTLEDQAAGGVFDSVTLAALVQARNPGSIFEIGTGFGRSATLFALNVPTAKIFTLSLPNNPATGRIFHRRPWAERIQQLEGESATFDYTPWHGRMDFVFIDGWHGSPIVEKDSADAFKLVAPGGWIVWHDVAQDEPDVIRAVCGVTTPGVVWIRGTRFALWRAGHQG